MSVFRSRGSSVGVSWQVRVKGGDFLYEKWSARCSWAGGEKGRAQGSGLSSRVGREMLSNRPRVRR
jgi:hypothetical protein